MIFEVEYGEYPQKVVDDKLSSKLEELYNNNFLRTTSKIYSADSVSLDEYNNSIEYRDFIEYVYNRRKYIRFVADENSLGKTLSDGRVVKEGDVYWLAVEPIKWIVEKRKNIALAKQILFAGVQFDEDGYKNNTNDYRITPEGYKFNSLFRNDIMSFLHNIFARNILPSKFNSHISEDDFSYMRRQKNMEEVIEKIRKIIKYYELFDIQIASKIDNRIVNLYCDYTRKLVDIK